MSHIFQGPPVEPEHDHDHDHVPEHAQYAEYANDEYANDEDRHVVYAEELPSRRERKASKRVRRRRRRLIFCLVFAMFVGVVFFVVQTVSPLIGQMGTQDYPGPGHGSITFVVSDGATGRTVAAALHQDGVVASDQAFLDALSAANASGLLQPGTFTMKLQMKASDAVKILVDASGPKVSYAAIDQNLRETDVLAILAKSTGIPLETWNTLAHDPAEFGVPTKAGTLEGYLAPGEYRFPVTMTAKQILTQLVNTTKKELVAAGVKDATQQYRILTIASILEAEGTPANYTMISGAIENRLNNPSAETGGRLESDATVAYGLGIQTYNITDAEKNDKSNLYNTFANPGLPVGPIGSPMPDSINAAIHPKANPYYFWVTVNLDTGETLYATTYAQHLKNVAIYTKWCTSNPGKCD